MVVYELLRQYGKILAVTLEYFHATNDPILHSGCLYELFYHSLPNVLVIGTCSCHFHGCDCYYICIHLELKTIGCMT